MSPYIYTRANSKIYLYPMYLIHVYTVEIYVIHTSAKKIEDTLYNYLLTLGNAKMLRYVNANKSDMKYKSKLIYVYKYV